MKDSILAGDITTIPRKNSLSLCTPSARWDDGSFPRELKKYIDDRIVITANDIPVYDAQISEMSPSIQNIDFKKYYELEYWHLNPTNLNHTYDHVVFKLTAFHDIGLIISYEVKVNGTPLGTQPMRVLELGKKQVINFFDYTGDTSQHPKKSDQVEIIAHDIFGNTHTVFSGKAELSNALWIEHYKISEWHQTGAHFDALYLAPIPTAFTENIKSYGIRIGQKAYESVSLERQDNGGYIRDQRLKLDFSKKIPRENLPQLGESITLIICTLEKETVMIDLGKIVVSKQPDRINALEEEHEITKWTKDRDYYTHVQFNKGSEHIKSYVLKMNNRYFGEIPVNQATTDLDLSKLDTGKKIRKGDYIEIYAQKNDGEEILIQSRYAGTTGPLAAYPAKEKIQQEYHVTSWSKVTDSYTSFTLGPLSDPIDSYIKKYEGCINNSIINLTPNGLTFTFDTNKGPRHGDTVQLFAYTYSGDKIELWKLPAGAIGTVTDEEVRFIHTIKEWEDTNQTIVFDTSKLQDIIQAHVKSYTIEVLNGSQKKWEPFGNPIQMNAQGQLRLQECNASQLLPQPPNIVRVMANLVDFGRKPVVAIRKVGSLKSPPTEQEMKAKHTTYTETFTDNNKKIESLTFLNIDNELASYISGYDVQDVSGTVNGPITHTLTLPTANMPGVTVTFQTPIPIKHQQETSIGSGHTTPIDVDLSLYALVDCIIIEEEKQPEPQQKLTSILVMGTLQGDKSIKGVTPHPSISPEEIKQAHTIDEWDYTGTDGKVRQFYFNKKIEAYVKDIKYYSVKINGIAPPQNQKIVLLADKEEKHTTKQGFPIRFGDYGLTDSPEHPLPKSGDTLEVIAHLQNSATQELTVIQCTIPSEFSPLSKVQTRELKNAHHIDGHWVQSGNVYTTLFFNTAVEPYLNQIDYYSININGVEYQPKSHPYLGLEAEAEINLPTQKGLPIRFQSLGVEWKNLPTDRSSIEIFANLKAPGGTDESNQPTTKISVYQYEPK